MLADIFSLSSVFWYYLQDVEDHLTKGSFVI